MMISGGHAMNHRWLLSSGVLLVLLLGSHLSDRAQDVPSQTPQDPSKNSAAEHARHAFALGVMRTINTAEAVDQMTYGHYSDWQLLFE
jgi:hypothetical protein